MLLGAALTSSSITANNEREAVRQAVGHGVEDYLVKPFTVDEFKQRLALYAQRVSVEHEPEPDAPQTPG